MVLPVRIELTTSPLPRECSTTELRQRRGVAGWPRQWSTGGPRGYTRLCRLARKAAKEERSQCERASARGCRHRNPTPPISINRLKCRQSGRAAILMAEITPPGGERLTADDLPTIDCADDGRPAPHSGQAAGSGPACGAAGQTLARRPPSPGTRARPPA